MNSINNLEEKYGVKIGGIFPGSNPNATHDEIINEIDRSLQAIVAGDFEEVNFED